MNKYKKRAAGAEDESDRAKNVESTTSRDCPIYMYLEALWVPFKMSESDVDANLGDKTTSCRPVGQREWNLGHLFMKCAGFSVFVRLLVSMSESSSAAFLGFMAACPRLDLVVWLSEIVKERRAWGSQKRRSGKSDFRLIFDTSSFKSRNSC